MNYQVKEEKNLLVIEDAKRKTEMMKFCIISSFRTQACRNSLLIFTLDNPV